ncbi:Argonaute-binding protein 1 [Fusarium austroafricanum]|uniref:Argonaute-binding protein 1 n=1 Tax=Fusarium austroafricanum TaxID=2364996 RepID=A0A8H4P0M8_9HYPO|nr:Argonaute-binding protein 1 [Fusarium austroafricanum]
MASAPDNCNPPSEPPCEEPLALPESLQGIAKKSKKRKSKTTASRGPTALSKKRGTGFEEYFADPPMTPDEAKEEKDEIYSPDLTFPERMQNCISRFRSRRRLQGERTLFFDEYLFLGGVDTSPSVFRGMSQQELKELTPAQRREATATDIIWANSQAGAKYYDGDEEKWSVNFAAVVAGFFSVTLPHLTSFEDKRMQEGIDTIENFLRYILQHDVCPEYEDDIKTAMDICKTATVEWPMIRKVYAALPGFFNLAASELFCPEGTASKSWSFLEFNRPDKFDPKAVFYSAFALMDEPQLFEDLSAKTPTVTREFTCTLELVQMFRPHEVISQLFKCLVIGDSRVNHAPIGKATFKQGVIKDDWENPQIDWPIEEDTMTLFFDDTILKNMMPGLKMTATICELDAGLQFVKAVEIIVPSFYVYLPQEMMRYYKEPRENDRPGPSVNDALKVDEHAEEEE